MRIGFDRNFLFTASRTRGIGRYACNLLEAVQARLPDGWSIHTFDPDPTYGFDGIHGRLQQFLRDQVIDLYVIPSPFEPLFLSMMDRSWFGGVPTAVIIHDFIPLKFPDVYLPSPEQREAYSRALQFARESAIVLANSEFTKGEAIGLAGFGEQNLSVLSAGVESKFQVLSGLDKEEVRSRYGIAKPFVMFTGNIEYRKNLRAFLQAFALANRKLGGAYRLVVVSGLTDGDRALINQWAEEAGAREDLVMTGFVDDQELVRLYNAAEVLACPSLQEGFGFPVLEAMRCGTPVLAAIGSALEEVAGDAAVLADPSDVSDMAEKLANLLQDGSLREQLRQRGLERAESFTWDRVADRFLSILRQLGGRQVLYPNRILRRPHGVYVSYNMAELPPGARVLQAMLQVRSPKAFQRLRIHRIARGWSVAKARRRPPSRRPKPIFQGRTGRFRRLLWECTELAERWNRDHLDNHGLYIRGASRRWTPTLQVYYGFGQGTNANGESEATSGSS